MKEIIEKLTNEELLQLVEEFKLLEVPKNALIRKLAVQIFTDMPTAEDIPTFHLIASMQQLVPLIILELASRFKGLIELLKDKENHPPEEDYDNLIQDTEIVQEQEFSAVFPEKAGHISFSNENSEVIDKWCKLKSAFKNGKKIVWNTPFKKFFDKDYTVTFLGEVEEGLIAHFSQIHIKYNNGKDTERALISELEIVDTEDTNAINLAKLAETYYKEKNAFVEKIYFPGLTPPDEHNNSEQKKEEFEIDFNNVPADVVWVWFINANKMSVGEKLILKAKETINKYPEYFSEEFKSWALLK